jgi:hypothetical protein
MTLERQAPLPPESPTPSTGKPQSRKSPRESPRANRLKWNARHCTALKTLGIISDGSTTWKWTDPGTWQTRANYAFSIIASRAALTRRTVLRCYDGKPVRPSTLLSCAQAARIQGLGEPPGSPRFVRE